MVSKRRNTAIFFTILLSLLLNSSEAYTADWPAVYKKIQSKYEAFKQEITDLTMEQEITQKIGMEITSRAKLFKKGDKFRMEMVANMGGKGAAPGGSASKSSIIYDGKDTWIIMPFIGKQKIPAKEALKHQANRDWWDLFSSDSRLTGQEKVAERDCYVIEMSEEEPSPYDKVWVDIETLVMVKGESGAQDSTAPPMTWVNSDFRKVDDKWEMPYRTDIYTDGTLASTAITKSIKINKVIPDDFFNPHLIKADGPGLNSLMQGMLEDMMSRDESLRDREEEKDID